MKSETCPRCEAILNEITHKEPREHFGIPCWEVVVDYFSCCECGWRGEA